MEIMNINNTWYGYLIMMSICSYMIAKSCDIFESSTDYLGRNLSDGVKGATLNAIGSSMPEFLTTVFFLVFALSSNLGRDFVASVGGDTGSAIFNSIVIPMLIIGIVKISSMGSIKISKKVILRDGLFLIGAEVLLLILLSSNYITHWHGWIFTFLYLIYLSYTLLSMKKNENEISLKHFILSNNIFWFKRYQFKSEKGRTFRSWVLLIFSISIIAICCAGLVEGCKGIAEILKIDPLFISLVLVAAATSIPDTIISMKDAKKGNYDDALSNVLGSNIFDITISMGLPLAIFLMITDQKINFIQAGPAFIDIRIMLLIITIITIGIYYFSKEMKKIHIIFLGILYIIFILYTIGAVSYLNGGNLFLARPAGLFIEFLRKPGGIGEILQNTANYITGSW